MNNVVIVGATSAIAQASARVFAKQGADLFLVARDEQKLSVVADDLRARYQATVHTMTMDACTYERHDELLSQACQCLGAVDVLLIAHGTLPDQAACESSFDMTRKEFDVNCLSAISLMGLFANYFENRQAGTIAVISSVAGDRGRQSNYVYGAAKGAVTLFAQGIRNRLARSGVKVLTIKPGFVDTPMTAAFDKGALWATPEQVAEDIYTAIKKGKDVLYTPWFWRFIMLIIKSIPEFIFKKLSL